MKKYVFELFIGILSSFILFLSGCNPSTPQKNPSLSVSLPDTIDLLAASHPDSVKKWNKSNLFQNTIEPVADKIILGADSDSAAIEIRAFQHKYFDNTNVLPATWVLGYVRAGTPKGTESLPGPTIETKYGIKTRVHFENKLQETLIENSNYPTFEYKGKVCKWYPIVYNLQNTSHIHALADMLYPTLSKDVNGITICGRGQNTDSIPEMASYYGTTVHLHGSNSAWRYDGYPNNHYWDNNSSKKTTHGIFGPNEIENGVARTGLTHYYTNDFPEPNFEGTDTTRGKHGAILWYHDHAMMHTAAHVYAGMLAPYIIQGQDENSFFSDNSKEKNDVYVNSETSGKWYWRSIWNKIKSWFGYEAEDNDIPLVINDKSFLNNGLLYYNSTADSVSSENKEGIQPEFFGDAMVVNGKVWPKMPVSGQTYRFRVLNTCSSRTLSLALATKLMDGTNINFVKDTTAKCYQIGTESGLIPIAEEITVESPLTLAPGERADILIDFGQIEGSKDIALLNFAGNSPFGDLLSIMNLDRLNAIVQRGDTLSNVVMQFELKNSSKSGDDLLEHKLNKLKENAEKDKNDILNKLVKGLLDRSQMKKDTIKKSFPLNLIEYTSATDLVGTSFGKLMPDPKIYPLVLMNSNNWDSEKENKAKNIPDDIKYVDDQSDYEVWRIINNTPDMHPIHIHLNRFEILGRCDLSKDKDVMPIKDLIPPSPHEIGWKDVVQVPTGQVTYIRIKYKLNPNKNPLYGENSKEDAQFVYHCHILEHEDVSMMRRLVVKQKK